MTTFTERPSSVYLQSPTSLNFDLNNYDQPIGYSWPQEPRHIWIITGPAGCGKSSVAEYLSKQLRLPYIEGDDYHPPANVAKMSAGIPLNDEDRWEWLETLKDKAVEELECGAKGAVVTCSALKRKYRDVIRLAGQAAPDVCVRFVYLRANVDLLIQRVKARKNHFMKDEMVRSQFVALEEPNASEPDVISVDVSGTLKSVQRETLSQVEFCMEHGF